MSRANEPLPIGRLIVVPSLITLAITLLRLFGELRQWSPTFFSTKAGGGGALVGIAWLAPIFGIYFALMLNKIGRGPASRGRAIGFAVAGILSSIAMMFVMKRLDLPLVQQIPLSCVFLVVAAIIAYRGWPELGRVALAYGLAARIPVIAVTWFALAKGWQTHYSEGAPGLPDMSLIHRWLFIGVQPQLLLWVSFTVIVSILCGGLVLFFTRPNPGNSSDTAAQRG